MSCYRNELIKMYFLKIPTASKTIIFLYEDWENLISKYIPEVKENMSSSNTRVKKKKKKISRLSMKSTWMYMHVLPQAYILVYINPS